MEKATHESYDNAIYERYEITLRLMPAFRDKFDFSDPKHFEALVDISLQAADALLAKRNKEMSANG